MQNYDKSKLILFGITLVLVATCVFLIVSLKNKQQQFEQLKLQTAKVAETSKETSNPQVETIKTFYQTMYTYENSPKDIRLNELKEKTTERAFKEVENEIRANTMEGTSQQNMIQSSLVQKDKISTLPFQTNDDKENQYLVTVPINKKVNNETYTYDLIQIVQVNNDTNKIDKRTAVSIPNTFGGSQNE